MKKVFSLLAAVVAFNAASIFATEDAACECTKETQQEVVVATESAAEADVEAAE